MSEIYWITRLDMINVWLLIFSLISGVIMVVSAILYIVGKSDYDELMMRNTKSILKPSTITFFICLPISILTPTKDEHAYKLLKFDITTLKPFKSEVLIRNDKTQKWIPAFWGYKADNGNYVTTFGACRYCIPYEGNEHLLRTSNDCDDYYKIWEA